MKVAWAHDVVISLSSLCPSAIAALCAGRAVSGAIAIRAYLGGEDPERERPRQIQCGFEGAACELSREPVQSQTPRGLFAWNRLDEFYGDFSYQGGGNHAARNQFLDVYFMNLICPNASAVLSGEDYQE